MDSALDEDPPPPTPARDARLGMLLAGRYRIAKKLGEGGMGAVYEAEHVLIGKRVAIKTLHAHLATDPGVVTRFHREARAATAIGNEHIVEVTDFGSFPDGAAFMVLEHLDGVELADLVEREGPLSLGRAVHVLAQLCDALAAAHDKGIIHRDLKPENLILIRRGDDPDFVKVLDFGISKILDDASAVGGPKLTSTGTAMGTPYYMAPEQALGARTIDARTDIYAIGVIFFNLLTGRHPFEGTSLPMLVVQICHDAPPKVRELRPDVPEAIEAVIAKMLAKDASERFASCREVKAAILPFAEARSAPVLAPRPPAPDPFAETLAPAAAEPPPVTPRETASAPAPRRLSWIGAALGVAGALAIGAAITLGGDPGPSAPEPPPETGEPPQDTVAALPVASEPSPRDAGPPTPPGEAQREAPVAARRPRVERPPARAEPSEPEAPRVEAPTAEPASPAPAADPAEPAPGLAVDVPALAPTKRPRLFGGGSR